MRNTDPVPILELSDAELDAVAAAGWGYMKQVALFNVAAQYAENNQANAAFVNIHSDQGGNQYNNNNAGNQS